jgi:hypothetical protein
MWRNVMVGDVVSTIPAFDNTDSVISQTRWEYRRFDIFVDASEEMLLSSTNESDSEGFTTAWSGARITSP